MAHTPRDVLAKNFGISGKTLENLPREELFIFQADPPGPLAEHQRAAAGSLGITQYDFAFRANQPAVTKRTQGWRSADCRLHHLQSIDDRSRGHRDRPSGWAARSPLACQRGLMAVVHGQGRMTGFATGGRARNLDFETGDVGYVQKTLPHDIENTGK